MNKTMNILSLSPCASDHGYLADILPWRVLRASSLPGAMQLLRRRQIGVVVCERDLPPYSWKDLLVEIAALPKAPLVIVTSLHADDYLWAEALNLGAYDVLPKPFDAAEVKRSMNMAVLH